MNKTTVHIKGMHCRSCEILIEDELLKIPGVKSVEVSHRKATAEVYYQNHLDQQDLEKAVQKVGYSLGVEEKSWISTNPNDWTNIFISGIILFILFYIARDLGLFNIGINSSNNYSSLLVVLLIGLTAGFSTCMALVGGLVLGASARFAKKHPEANSLQKFKPHIFFNLGRIIAFFVLGGIIGAAGAFFQLSTSTLGFLTILVGGVMLLLGLQLTELFPKLNGINFTLPKSIGRLLGIKNDHQKEYSHKNSMFMGALTFFLPCGFTQAMQLFAISSGNPITGALTMGTFAIGTAPGLLGIGGLTSVIKGAFAKSFFKFVGLVVVFLALFNISNGSNLIGVNLGFLSFNNSAQAQSSDPNVTQENGTQIVKMSQNAYGYSPNSFTIKKDIPVKWIINSEDVNTCAASIVSAKLGVRKILELGENVIEFTPIETGIIRFSCAMGMYTGSFNVTDENGTSSGEVISPIANNNAVSNNTGGGCGGASRGGCGGGGGGGCGGGARKTRPIIEATPIPQNSDNAQLIKTIFTQNEDIQPNKFIVKSGIPVRMEIEAKEDGAGCMGSIFLPGLVKNPQLLNKGETIVFNFTPPRPGQYEITCAMGVPRGVIVAN